jgi:GH25 family lysozyme M1 (1,4-beta-N-acetylmuramidase)
MHNKIGFLTGVGGNATGIGDYVNRCDAAGVPAIIGANDDVKGIADILKLDTNVPHQMLYRVVVEGGEPFAVPRYDLTPLDAALEYHERIRNRIHPMVVDNKDKVWIALGNELDRKRSNWLGEWAYESAGLWNSLGYKVAMFGFASGTPEPLHWETPGMLKFLRLAGNQRKKISVNLHEYSYDNDILRIFPYRVGRFQYLFDMCDTLGIARPAVWIGEWGWFHDRVPNASAGMPQLADVSRLYSQFDTILGAASWTLQNWNTEIYNQLNSYITPVTIHSIYFDTDEFSRQEEIFIPTNVDYSDDLRSIAIDISRHNNPKNSSGGVAGPVDFERMAQKDVVACYMRGSIGKSGMDDAFKVNSKAIEGTDILAGMYHLVNTKFTAQENLDNIIGVVSEYGHLDLRIAIDVEPLTDSSGNYLRIDGDKVSTLVNIFLAEFGYYPVVYTARWVMSYVDGDKSWAESFPVWLAEYWNVPPQPEQFPKPIGNGDIADIVMHQWTSSYFDGRDWGVASQGLDVNYVYDIEELIVGYIPPVDPPVEPPEPDPEFTTASAKLPQEVGEDYWSELARHAYRDNKRDMTASMHVAEAIYLRGKPGSWIKVLDPD